MIVTFEPRASDIIRDLSMMLLMATVYVGGGQGPEGEHSLEKGAELWERSFRLGKGFGARSDTGSTVDASGPGLCAN